ncbi:hypothetical protein evm_001031 [Chilo suppressalis]|nr:hypothetical protein evm_001031 [Chilo suppressalis]
MMYFDAILPTDIIDIFILLSSDIVNIEGERKRHNNDHIMAGSVFTSLQTDELILKGGLDSTKHNIFLRNAAVNRSRSQAILSSING